MPLPDLKPFIVITENFPRPGITCYDVAPILKDPVLFRQVVEELALPYLGARVDAVVGIEARGFVVAGALAYRLGIGLVLIRKKGKLPPPTLSQEYSYEYASNVIEVATDAIRPDQRVILVDDVLATGGTLAAAKKLVERAGGQLAGASVILTMNFMAGSDRLQGTPIHSLVRYD